MQHKSFNSYSKKTEQFNTWIDFLCYHIQELQHFKNTTIFCTQLPTNLQNFVQKDLTEVKIFQKVLGGGGYFF